jgi:hypothetical protein
MRKLVAIAAALAVALSAPAASFATTGRVTLVPSRRAITRSVTA